MENLLPCRRKKLNTKVMANVRNLKRDIDSLMSQVLTDCFYSIEYNPKVDEKAVMEIAGTIIEKHHEFRVRANHPDGKDDPKQVKKYFNVLIAEALAAADQAYEALSAEIKKVA